MRATRLGASSTVALTYDQLGRIVGTSINGSANSSSITLDSLGRLSGVTNLLGTFTYGYVGVTPRLQTVSSTNGPTTNYSYTSLPNDIRLSQIQNVLRRRVSSLGLHFLRKSKILQR